MKENKVLNLSKEFALEIIELCKENKLQAVLSNQLLRSATSIGANVHEANYAISKPDFISKMQIALKECYESEYWLELVFKSKSISEEIYNNLQSMCGSIRRILIASLNTAKGKQ